MLEFLVNRALDPDTGDLDDRALDAVTKTVREAFHRDEREVEVQGRAINVGRGADAPTSWSAWCYSAWAIKSIREGLEEWNRVIHFYGLPALIRGALQDMLKASVRPEAVSADAGALLALGHGEDKQGATAHVIWWDVLRHQLGPTPRPPGSSTDAASPTTAVLGSPIASSRPMITQGYRARPANVGSLRLLLQHGLLHSVDVDRHSMCDRGTDARRPPP